MRTITLSTKDGQEFDFQCADVADGIPVDPMLPENFDDTSNELRLGRHLAWWDVPFIITHRSDDPKFLEHWPSGTTYVVRCLDGGAWDRSTWWGQFGSLEEAVAQAKKGTSVWNTTPQGT